MKRTGTITMATRELDRLKIIQAVVDGTLKPSQAAERLALTDRQVRRLVNRVRQDGAPGIVSRRRGKPSNNRLPSDLATMAIDLIRTRYADFGPTLACEKLREVHGLMLAKETVRKLMADVGLWVPRKLRSASVYQPRNRRHCVGELIQIDGSDHAWFEDRAPACTLLVFIDDATSRLMQLHFTYSESTFSYFEATQRYIEQHGKPQAFYSDQYSVFRVNKKDATSGDGHTQFGRAMYELNIEIICANSSQAKGRVERANQTLQDRLVKELRLQGISTMEAANAYAPSFIADFNARFAKPPRNDWNAHRPLRADEDLALVFSHREQRKVSQSLTLQYDKMLYLLADVPENRRLIGKYIDVYEYPDGRIEVRDGLRLIECATYDRLSEINQGAIVANKRLSHTLQIAQLVQEQRDNRRSQSVPARSNQGLGPVRPKAITGKKSQRSLSDADLAKAISSVAIRKLNDAPRPHLALVKIDLSVLENDDLEVSDTTPGTPNELIQHTFKSASVDDLWNSMFSNRSADRRVQL